MRRRHRALFITALSSSSWVSVDSFVPPQQAHPFMTGGNGPDNRRFAKGAVEKRVEGPRLANRHIGIRARAGQGQRATSNDAGTAEEEAEVVVIGSGIAG
ncbi:unnamed protein product [Hapterophycus canaliculatus]